MANVNVSLASPVSSARILVLSVPTDADAWENVNVQTTQSVTMSMANVGAQEAGMGGNVTYPAHRAPLGPTVATNATATTKPHAIRLMVVANANLVLLERAVKNTAPKATGVKIVIVLVNVQMPILYVTLFMGVFAGLDLQVANATNPQLWPPLWTKTRLQSLSVVEMHRNQEPSSASFWLSFWAPLFWSF